MAYDSSDPGITTTVKVSGVEINDNRYKITTSGGDSFSFFQEKKDGQPTAAYKGYKELKVGPGSVVEIWYKESEGTGRTGNPVTYRNILSFKPPLDDPDETPAPRQAPAQKPASRPQNAPQSAIKTIVVDEARLEAEIIGKTATQFMAAAIHAGLTLDQAQGEVYKAVMLAERLVNASKGPRKKLNDLTVPWEAEEKLANLPPDDSDIEFP